jgi:hypothetical protein
VRRVRVRQYLMHTTKRDTIGLVWFGLDWIGLDRIGFVWIAVDWSGLAWSGLARMRRIQYWIEATSPVDEIQVLP